MHQVMGVSQDKSAQDKTKLGASWCQADCAGAWKDEQCKDLIQGKGPFVFCALGCVFVNDPYWESELTETKALLEQKGIPYAKMPTFGDVRTVLQEAGLLDLEEKLIDQQPVAAIAG